MSIGTPQIVPLTGSATIREITRLAETLRAALAAASEVTVDCSGLTEIDLAAIQLLVAAHKSARAAGTSLTLRMPADGPLPALLRQAGFIAADGRALTSEGDLWTQGKAA